MTMGALKGMILAQTASGPAESCTAIVIITKEKIIGSVMGSISDCASWGSSFTALPTAANKAE